MESAPDEQPALAGAERRRRRRQRREAGPSAQAEQRWTLISIAALAVIVAGSVLAVGTVHAVTLVVVAGLAVLAATALLLQGERWPIPSVVCSALAAYTVFQAVPLPRGLVATVAPANAQVWASAHSAFRESAPGWLPISLDPGATWHESLKWATYALVFFVATAVARRRGPGWGLGVVFVASVTAAFATVGHGLAGAKMVFGLYEPMSTPAPWHLGPLLNPNNLSGYLTLGTLCGLGLLLTRRPLAPRWLVGLGVATNVAVNVTAASRAGAIALPVGVLLLGVTMLWRNRHRAESDAVAPGTARWLVAVALAGGAVLALLGATTETWKELWDQNIEKLTATRWVIPLVREHVWVGVGRGAFESVFPAFRQSPGNLVFTHAESFPVDWAAGWGLPVTLLALLAFAWALRPRLLGVRSSALAAAGWAGVVALSFQNLADLGLEVPAVPIAAATVWGSLWGERLRRSRTSWVAEPQRVPWRAAVVVAATTALSMAVVTRARHDLTHERRALHERFRALGDGADARTQLRHELRTAMLRHPAEPYFPLVGAALAWKARDQDPLPWLTRVLLRDLTSGRAHLLLAEVLAGRAAKSQALLELRLAVTDDAALADPAARLATRWTQDCDELVGVAPSGEPGAAMLCTITELADASTAHCRPSLVGEAIARSPADPRPRMIAASTLLQHIRNPQTDSACAAERRATCEADVERHAQVIEAGKPRLSSALQIRAQLVRFRGDPANAEQMLREACAGFDDRIDCLRARVEIASEMQPPSALLPAIKDYLSAACSSSTACADASTAMGDLLAARGDWGGATTFYERATREHPTEARWLGLANAASHAGSHAQAAAAFAKVLQLRGRPDADISRRIDDEKRKALGLR